MAMQAKIKFNKTTENQANQLSILLENLFAASNVELVLEQIDYQPVAGKSIFAVYRDLNKDQGKGFLEINLFNWKHADQDTLPIQRIEQTIWCNLREKEGLSPINLLNQVAGIVINQLVGRFADDFAQRKNYTADLLERYIHFNVTAKAAMAQVLPNADQGKNQRLQNDKILIIDKALNIWVQVDQYSKVEIPLGNGWEKALYLFMLEFRDGFSFEDFRPNSHGFKLAEYYCATKVNASKSNVSEKIRHYAQSERLSKIFSPHFTRMRNIISNALQAYPNINRQLNITTQGNDRLILMDRALLSKQY
jgi:hypothetical protein